MKKKAKNKKSKRHKTVPFAPSQPFNFFSQAGPGCHIARPKELQLSCPASSSVPLPPSWVLEWETIDPSEYGDEYEKIPDIAVDPLEKTLSLCNTRTESVVAYITVFGTLLRDRQRKVLEQGSTTTSDGTIRSDVTTLIVLCPAQTFCTMCYLDNMPAVPEDLQLESDVQVWNQHPRPTDAHPMLLDFPFGDTDCPVLCTQGVGGHLTHFFAGNLHAIDFRCPVGTSLHAVGNGTVAQVKVDASVSGIAVDNLFDWNSVLLKLDTADENDDGPLFVEYVHVATVLVAVGDSVQRGDKIATSGNIGFSPEPHLHFAAYRTAEASAATVQVQFVRRGTHEAFLPVSGCWYDTHGKTEPP